MLRPFLIAAQFLTRLPIPRLNTITERDTGRSMLFYPLVGLIIGLLLAALLLVMGKAPPALQAALLLAVWVLITGGLHLDGLADSADAWVGGLGDRERTLAIMKDPNCGPAGGVAIVLVLLLKFAALDAAVVSGDWTALLLAPVLGRTAPPLLFLTTPYVRRQGLGSTLTGHLPRRTAALVTAATAAAILLSAGINALWPVISATGVFALCRAMMVRRIGGATGDTAGALVEITETAVLITAVLLA